MSKFLYTRETAKEISFPLGGIGAGCLGLAGNGSIIEPEIFNRPNKSADGYGTHFAVKAENAAGVVSARVLQSDFLEHYSGTPERNFGFGPERMRMCGLPHFENCEFTGEFPLARLTFDEACFPARVRLTAFNPFIPSNDFDSSLPGAMFECEFTNTSAETLTYTMALTASDYYANAARRPCIHESALVGGFHALFMRPDMDKADLEYGDVCVMASAPEMYTQKYWFRGRWFDDLSMWWRDFSAFGTIKDRDYQPFAPRDYGTLDAGALAGRMTLRPGESGKMRFVIAWNCPNVNNHWQLLAPNHNDADVERIRSKRWKNWYATKFESSLDTAGYMMRNFTKLFDETALFTNAMYASSLPDIALEAVTANLAVLKSPTCLRLEDGSFYAFEGVTSHGGSCEGTCTHVWSYAYALAFLFPSLERSARTLEYTRSVDEYGGMGFRLQLPLGEKKSDFRACVDGQFGTVMRVWREYAISGDKEWLSGIWESVKRTIAYAWSKDNPDGWDMDMDGVMEGRQHHTLDMELYGPSSWLTSMYLGGLKAGMRLARAMGDADAYALYERVFENGRAKLNDELFNGEYFYQKVDLADRSLLTQGEAMPSLFGQSAESAYWNTEAGEIKYQVAEGCLLDQILGQWHADLLGLGGIIDTNKAKSALNAIYTYNFVPRMRDYANPCRVYCLDGEQGLIICAYPPGRVKPALPVPYAEETMTGFEYQAASHMIMHGLEEEGLRCVAAVRDRYDGKKRNPFNEIECGSNYARTLASYALLLAYSGFMCDMSIKQFTLRPLRNGRYFWAIDGAWGMFTASEDGIKLEALYGSVTLRRLRLAFRPRSARIAGSELAFEISEDGIIFQSDCALEAGKPMYIGAQ